MTSENSGPVGGSRPFPTLLVIGAGLVGLVLGAIATFAITGLVWTVRVELPPPPYPPPFSSTAPQGCITPVPPPTPGIAPAPAPPLPPPPHG